MKCPYCERNEAIKDNILGIMPCSSCQSRMEGYEIPEPIEITTKDIKEQRKMHKGDILQPYRGGVLSKEYIDRHGTKGLEIKPGEKAQRVWSDNSYYKD